MKVFIALFVGSMIAHIGQCEQDSIFSPFGTKYSYMTGGLQMIENMKYGRIKTSVKSEITPGSRTTMSTHNSDYSSYIYTRVVPEEPNPVVIEVNSNGLYDCNSVSDAHPSSYWTTL